MNKASCGWCGCGFNEGEESIDGFHMSCRVYAPKGRELARAIAVAISPLVKKASLGITLTPKEKKALRTNSLQMMNNFIDDYAKQR